MFVQENYQAIKKDNEHLHSKDIISMVANQWAQVSEEEKQIWRHRASTAPRDDQNLQSFENDVLDSYETDKKRISKKLKSSEDS